jgi:hypothetical protein
VDIADLSISQASLSGAGYMVELHRREPQGFNSTDLLLEKVIQEPSGPSAEVVTDVAVR